jgi:hypothetical protein
MHFTNAFFILSVHKISCQTGLIHQQFKNMYLTWQHVTIIIGADNEHAHSVAFQGQSMGSMASMFFVQGKNLVVCPNQRA